MARPSTAIKFVCEVCGKEFELSKSRRTFKHCYCSEKCMGIGQRVKRQIIIKDNHAEIVFQNGLIGLIDIEDVDKVKDYPWRAEKKELKNHEPYYYIGAMTRTLESDDKKRHKIMIHRLIMDCPKGLEVDHINHNPLDNRKINLRICTSSDNKRSRRSFKQERRENV